VCFAIRFACQLSSELGSGMCKLAHNPNSEKAHDSACIESADRVLQFIPLRADWVIPGEFHNLGWNSIASLLFVGKTLKQPVQAWVFFVKIPNDFVQAHPCMMCV